MFVRFTLTLMFFASSFVFAGDELVIAPSDLNRYLKSKRPYSEYVKKVEEVNTNCIYVNKTGKSDCEKKKNLIIDEEKMSELDKLIDSKQEEMRKLCKNPHRADYDKSLPELCNRFKALKNFLYVTKKLEECKTNWPFNSNSLIDRLVDAAGAVAEQDCLRDIKDSEALDSETSQIVNSLFNATSREVERKDFKDLTDFLIEDSLNESVKASLVYGAALGKSPDIDMDELCIAERKVKVGRRSYVNETYDSCGVSNRKKAQKLRQQNLKSEHDLISQQNIEISKNIINSKVHLLNKAGAVRNEAIREYRKNYKEFYPREVARIKFEYRLKGPPRISEEIGKAVDLYERKNLDPINQKFEIERNRILNEKARFGTDELYQTDFLRERLSLSFPRDKISGSPTELNEFIPQLTNYEITKSFEEASNRSDEQIAELMKMKINLKLKEREVIDLAKSPGGRRRGRSALKFGYEQQKEELMRLVQANPISVGRALINNPNFANNICKVTESLGQQDLNQEIFDKAFFIVGAGTLLAGVSATGGASAAVVLFRGAGVGLSLTGAELASNYYYINIEKNYLNDIKAASLIGTTDSKGLADIEISEDNLADLVLNAKITAVTGLGDLGGVGKLTESAAQRLRINYK